MYKIIAIILVVIQVCVCNLSNAQQQGLLTYEPSQTYAGYTLISIGSKAYLLDNCGLIINEWSPTSSASLMGNLTYDGNLLWMGRVPSNNTFLAGGGGGGRVTLFNEAGNTIWDYTHYVPNQYASHHDAEPLPNGNFLLISWEEISLNQLTLLGRDPSLNPNEFWSDYIIEIEPQGNGTANIVWEWHMIDHLVQDFNPNASTFGDVYQNYDKLDINVNPFDRDWLHMNGIDYNEEFDQIMFSCRHIDEIFIIDHSTTSHEAATGSGGNYNNGGNFLYRYGNPENYQATGDQVLFGQHDPRWITEGPHKGKISVFNNFGGTNIGDNTISTADIIDPQMDANGHYQLPSAASPTFMPAFPEKIFAVGPQTQNDSTFLASNQGGCQALPNGNMLISVPSPARVFELDSLQNIVWDYDIVNSGGIFKVVRYEQDFEGLANYDLTPGNTIEAASSPLSINCTVQYPNPCSFNVSINNFPSSTNTNTAISLSGTPAGGSFSGPGIIFGSFNPTIAGPGFHTISYTYNDGNGCIKSANESILVFNISFNFADFTVNTISPKEAISINLNALENETALVQLVDINGQIIAAQHIEVMQGAHNYQIKLNKNLSYQNILSINTSRQTISKKILNIE